METQLVRNWRRGTLLLCAGMVAVVSACSRHSSGAGPATTPSRSLDASARTQADAPGGRDLRRIRRYPGSWIAEAHDTFYVFCPDILVNFRDFSVDYATTEADGDRIVDFFKGELKRSGSYRVARTDKTDSEGRLTWQVDFRRPDAPLMCRANPSNSSERDAYDGDVRLTVERGPTPPTSIRLEVLLNLRADSPY